MMLMAMAKHVLQRLLAGLRSWQPRRRRRPRPTTTSKPRVVIRRFGTHPTPAPTTPPPPPVTIRVATFNAAMFSMAPPEPQRDVLCKPANGQQDPGQRPKSILKAAGLPQSPSKQLRVSINLQDDEISLERASKLQKAATTSTTGGGGAMENGSSRGYYVKGKAAAAGGGRSAVEVLREVGADVIALQNVRAEEERGMRPLSELAEGLGMRYVFADSWAPEYGNAVLSRWPIKRWKAQRVADHSDFREFGFTHIASCNGDIDLALKQVVALKLNKPMAFLKDTKLLAWFRNVLRATIEVPKAGELNFHCTHLDHLDEGWRMAQINSMLRSSDGGPHILAGGLNALDRTDYSTERWANIVKYYEEIGKPTPRAEVMKYLKGKQYVDAKDFAGECEAVVVVAKGQDVQGTCKYGTRVDYILASPNSPYRFVPGSYAVISSKGTSDHHIVKADMTIGNNINESDAACRRRKRRVMKMNRGSTKGILAAR